MHRSSWFADIDFQNSNSSSIQHIAQFECSFEVFCNKIIVNCTSESKEEEEEKVNCKAKRIVQKEKKVEADWKLHHLICFLFEKKNNHRLNRMVFRFDC